MELLPAWDVDVLPAKTLEDATVPLAPPAWLDDNTASDDAESNALDGIPPVELEETWIAPEVEDSAEVLAGDAASPAGVVPLVRHVESTQRAPTRGMQSASVSHVYWEPGASRQPPKRPNASTTRMRTATACGRCVTAPPGGPGILQAPDLQRFLP
jgi:hypothetical protein